MYTKGCPNYEHNNHRKHQQQYTDDQNFVWELVSLEIQKKKQKKKYMLTMSSTEGMHKNLIQCSYYICNNIII